MFHTVLYLGISNKESYLPSTPVQPKHVSFPMAQNEALNENVSIRRTNVFCQKFLHEDQSLHVGFFDKSFKLHIAPFSKAFSGNKEFPGNASTIGKVQLSTLLKHHVCKNLFSTLEQPVFSMTGASNSFLCIHCTSRLCS